MDLISSLFLVVMVDTDDTPRTIHDGRRTTPRVWHKLPTGELKSNTCAYTVKLEMFVDINVCEFVIFKVFALLKLAIYIYIAYSTTG